MKILFTADLHIKLKQKNVPTEFLKNRTKILFKELARVRDEEDCEIEIHGGDIFDKLPTLEELSIYIKYLWSTYNKSRMGVMPFTIIAYDGNHEATKKGDTFLRYLEGMVPPHVRLVTDYARHDDFAILPYCRLHDKTWDEKIYEKKYLFTHVRGAIPPHVNPEVALERFEHWDTVFAGDLHSHENTQKNIVYPGSPMTVSFHRNKVKTGVIVIDTKDWSWEWKQINIPQLIRKTVNDPKEMIKTDFDHTIYELTGNALDLAKVEKEDNLLDKKIILREEPAALELKNMSLREETLKYLSEIQNLDKDTVKQVMNIYDDYVKETNI